MRSIVKICTRLFFRGIFVIFVLLVFRNVPLFAQVKVLYVTPEQTDPAIQMVHSPNIAVYDSQAPPKHLLFFFIGGTGSKAVNSLPLDRTFARWGYHALSIDYENNLITTAMAHSTNPAAFDHYRDAIVTGAPVSNRIHVSVTNSILNRFQKLLAYLVKQDPKGGWDQFFRDGKPVWNRIIVAGHSQGAGHAAYIGKMFDVDRVIIFSGPQDYLDDLHEPAPWEGEKSATPPSRFFAFLSQNDPFNIHHQEASCRLIMDSTRPETLAINPGEPIHGHYQILVNDFPKKRAHGSTISTQFTNVWDYLITEGGK